MDIEQDTLRNSDARNIVLEHKFTQFLTEFQDDDGNAIYKSEIDNLVNLERNTLVVNLLHVHQYSVLFYNCIVSSYEKIYSSLCDALRLHMVESNPDKAELHLERKQFYIAFRNHPTITKLRELKSDDIGTLVSIKGQVIRTHPVHPELSYGTFICDECGVTIRDVKQEFRYTMPIKCTNDRCVNRVRFSLDVHESRFMDFQKIRIQEESEELPRGSIPRSLEVIIRGEQCERMQPGDRVKITGSLIVIPDVAMLAAPGIRADTKGAKVGEDNGVSGLKALGVRDLTYRVGFNCSHVMRNMEGFGISEACDGEMTHTEMWAKLTREERVEIKKMTEDPELEKKMFDTVFPNVWGYEEIKLGVLLMLFGGVAKCSKKEGTTLRGDINVCLVGDPSTAKSQILKRIEEFAPRAVYTSGKASSAAGLTAAVVKDEESMDFVIEAGALMLADHGVCCIDEFDKMDPKDQVAIHEAMEQQTISITKAGVKATLNARASILAAANPIGGRYDRTRPLKHNVQLSAPILSRFDLFFVLVDECSETIDFAIARRILDNHRNIRGVQKRETPYTEEMVKKYIAFARCFTPKITPEAADALVSTYKKLRLQDSKNAATSSWRITVRQLESLVRLSEALARMHSSVEVTPKFVQRAAELLTRSIIRVEQPDVVLDEEFDQLENVFVNEPSQGADSMEQDENVPPNESHRVEPSRLKISFTIFKHIADMLVLHMRADENKAGGEETYMGCNVSKLVEWYLSVSESTIETEEQLMEQKTICERVVKRLIHDRILVELEPGEDPVLIVHPNYVIEAE